MKKILSWIASLSLVLNFATATLAKDSSYEERRAKQYSKFYQKYADRDYKIIPAGTRTVYIGDESREETLIGIMYGNNIEDNIRFPFYTDADRYLKGIDKEALNYEGQNSEWYFRPMEEERKVIPIEEVPKEKLPQVMKDILKLPKDMQKAILGVVHYPIDGDSRLMIDDKLPREKIFEVCDKLKEMDEARDAKQKKDGLKPIIPTKNQRMQFHVSFTDKDKDGTPDHIVSRYCLDGSMFDPEAKIRRFHLLGWHEIDKEGKRKHDKPSRITIDFDQGEDYEEKGFDIEFYDNDNDGTFESYKFLKKEKFKKQ